MSLDTTPEITANHAWTGSRYVDVTRPRAEDIDPREVAIGLSREARYGAACTKRFWSVAQHSLLALHIAERAGLSDRTIRRTLLLHDGPEYILRDLIRPVKANVPGYGPLEAVWWGAFALQFDLPRVQPPVVKVYDNLALAVEKNVLIDPGCGSWPGIPDAPKCGIPGDLLFAGMDDVASVFLDRLERLR